MDARAADVDVRVAEVDVDVEENERLVEVAGEIPSKHISTGTRKSYVNNAVHFLVWLHAHHPGLVNGAFGEREDGVVNKSSLKEALSSSQRDVKPMAFSEVTADILASYMLSCKKRDGSQPQYSTLNNRRAAIANLFRDYGERMDVDEEAKFARCMKGIEKSITATDLKKEGKMSLKEDNAVNALDFADYVQICGYFLERGMHMAHLFLILSWNLACRSKSTDMICIDHLEWKGDALVVFFSHKNTDQTSRKSKQPRAVYANPLEPRICPLLALAMYLSVYPDVDQKLFPGQNQNKRFGALMKQAIAHLGMKDKKYGTHSVRKGAVSYCISSSTRGPNVAAVYVRAGWTLGAVQDCYVHDRGVGDQHVGRTLCGLPALQKEFAMLPPRFREGQGEREQEEVNAMASSCFPTITKSNHQIAEMLLASLIHHSDWIKEHLEGCTSLLQSSLFVEGSRSRMKEMIICDDDDGASMSPSGVPPDIIIMRRLESIDRKIDTVAPSTVDGVVQDLEERPVGLAQVTPHELKRIINEIWDERTAKAAEAEEATSVSDAGPVYTWGGRLHRIPEGYRVPSTSTISMWVLWWLGNKEDGVPPLRELTTGEWGTVNDKKRFCDARYIMRMLEDEATKQGLSLANMTTVDTVQDVFQKVKRVLPSVTIGRKRKRRRAQVNWGTMRNAISAAKRRKVADDDVA